jgi:hypothetical protein
MTDIPMKKSEERILTRHPSGKKSVAILRRRYDVVRSYIIKTIRRRPGITFEELSDRALEELQPTFDGKVLWYIVTVKLDLEARGEIERVPKTSPHRLRIRKPGSRR